MNDRLNLDLSPRKFKIRNYSFKNSKRLPPAKMTEMNGIRIPSMPGSCYHAIICALCGHKDKFCNWEKIYTITEKYMRQYGGTVAWDKFVKKSRVKSIQQRIKDNTHTLTRTGRDCYGYRLHERGMAIYFFKDGAQLITGGKLIRLPKDEYNVLFPDGRSLQVRYRGTTMTNKEYKKFVEMKLIDLSGRILNNEGIREYRRSYRQAPYKFASKVDDSLLSVCVTLDDNYGQDTAQRLEEIGFTVDQALGNELMGQISGGSIAQLRQDQDVKQVEVAGN